MGPGSYLSVGYCGVGSGEERKSAVRVGSRTASAGLSGHEDLALICHSMRHARLRVGFPMPDLGELALDSYSAFRKHCMDIHGLREDCVADSSMYLDLEKWTLTLLK